MTYWIIKVIGEDLFYNHDQRGEYMFPTPMVMEHQKAISILGKIGEILHHDEPRIFTLTDLEICEVNLDIVV